MSGGLPENAPIAHSKEKGDLIGDCSDFMHGIDPLLEELLILTDVTAISGQYVSERTQSTSSQSSRTI
jgi:hypothetical protein